MLKRLDGKVALVTGSTSGIGNSTVRLFAQEGARVVLTGRRRELGEESVRAISNEGGVASYFQADFTNTQEVRDTIRFTVDTYGQIDILMNNAVSWAAAQGKSVTDLQEEDWDHAMAIGLKAPYIACQEAIPHMRKQGGGSIIMIGSVRSFLAFRRGFAYDVVKAGLVNMARQLNLDYGREGIRANTLCPGQIVTNPQRLAEMQTNPLLRPFAEIIQPTGRPGQPIDVARAALFLASDDSQFIAGAVLVVDGGLTIQTPGSLLPQLEASYRQAFAEEWGIRLA